MTPQQIIDAWNAQADEANQWGALGEDEKLMWAYKQAIAEAEKQKPVAWMTNNGARVITAKEKENYPALETQYSIPLYTHPPQRKPLTDEEIAHATAPVFMSGNPTLTGIARAIEAAHGIKEKA